MAITEEDLHLYARRVRPHFPMELRDVAEELALGIARRAGSKTKLLRPESSLEEILSWMGVSPAAVGAARPAESRDSLDAVEAVMQLEDELGWDFPDALLGNPTATTFLQMVHSAAEQRARAQRW